MFVDKNGECESLLAAVVVLSVIAFVAIISGVMFTILYFKLRAAYKRLLLVFVFCFIDVYSFLARDSI